MDKKYIVSVGSSYLCELIITKEIAEMCFHCGNCDNEIKVAKEIPFIREQLNNLDETLMRNAVSDILGYERVKSMNRSDLEDWILFEGAALFVDGDYSEF